MSIDSGIYHAIPVVLADLEFDIEFNVEISGDQSQLQDVLALDGQLRPVDEITLEAQLDNILLFQWQEK